MDVKAKNVGRLWHKTIEKTAKRCFTKYRHAMASKFLGTTCCPIWTPKRCPQHGIVFFIHLNKFGRFRLAYLFPQILHYRPLCSAALSQIWRSAVL